MYLSYQGKRLTLTVGDPELIKLVTVKEATTVFLNRRNRFNDKLTDSMLFFTKDDQWRKVRSAISPTFSSGKMRKMIPIIHECTKALIENLKEQKQNLDIDVKEIISAFTMDVISSVAFATRVNSHKDPNNPIAVHAKKLFSNPTVMIDAFLFTAFPRISNFLRKLGIIKFFDTTFFEKLASKILEERKKENLSESEKRIDFLQLMIDAQKNLEMEQERISQDQNQKIKDPKDFQIVSKLTELEMFAQCVQFFTVGFDTTASTITCALHLLACHPDCQEKLYQEIQDTIKNKGEDITYDTYRSMPYLEAVICETLRLYPAVAFITRKVDEDFQFGDTGIQLKKGMDVNIPLIGLHYDSKYYPEPSKFKPERFLPENKDSLIPFTYMPFGMGPRICVALRFAQMEAKTAIVDLLREFQFTKSPRTKDAVQGLNGAVLFQPINIYLKIEERKP